MFELGKKDGSAQDAERVSATDRQEPRRSGGAEAVAASGVRGDVAVIGRSIQIDGDLRGEEDLRIEGDVNGTVRLHNNTLTVGSEGKIRANVFAKAVIVEGVMEGDLYGSERVSICRNATVLGNITAPRVSLEDGASFKGSIEMDPEAVKAVLSESGVVSSNTQSDSQSNGKGKANVEAQIAQPKHKQNGSGAARDSVG
jgi:cytoskeletal protein CcmA (bactofilin family)